MMNTRACAYVVQITTSVETAVESSRMEMQNPILLPSSQGWKMLALSTNKISWTRARLIFLLESLQN